MKKTLSLILLLSMMSALLLSGCAGPEEKAWQEGQQALTEENYSDAVAAFEKADGMQDAEQLLAYARAMQDLEDGDCAKAREGFNALGDFKDSLLMVSYCRAREQEAAAQMDFSSGETDTVVTTAGEAETAGMPVAAGLGVSARSSRRRPVPAQPARETASAITLSVYTAFFMDDSSHSMISGVSMSWEAKNMTVPLFGKKWTKNG